MCFIVICIFVFVCFLLGFSGGSPSVMNLFNMTYSNISTWSPSTPIIFSMDKTSAPFASVNSGDCISVIANFSAQFFYVNWHNTGSGVNVAEVYLWVDLANPGNTNLQIVLPSLYMSMGGAE